jgi:short chain dehydrogenase
MQKGNIDKSASHSASKVEQPANKTMRAISRRRMLLSSAGAFMGASMIRDGSAAPIQADIGEKTPHTNFSLQGKAALVTGAARGIGQAICVALAAAGAEVMGLDICAAVAPNLVYPPATPEDLDKTGKLVEAQKRRWIGVKADIRDMAAMKSAVDRAVKEVAKKRKRRIPQNRK